MYIKLSADPEIHTETIRIGKIKALVLSPKGHDNAARKAGMHRRKNRRETRKCSKTESLKN